MYIPDILVGYGRPGISYFQFIIQNGLGSRYYTCRRYIQLQLWTASVISLNNRLIVLIILDEEEASEHEEDFGELNEAGFLSAARAL